jgi:hypothetical protein
LKRIHADVGERDPRALRRQQLGGGASDAAGCARDENAFALTRLGAYRVAER